MTTYSDLMVSVQVGQAMKDKIEHLEEKLTNLKRSLHDVSQMTKRQEQDLGINMGKYIVYDENTLKVVAVKHGYMSAYDVMNGDDNLEITNRTHPLSNYLTFDYSDLELVS